MQIYIMSTNVPRFEQRISCSFQPNKIMNLNSHHHKSQPAKAKLLAILLQLRNSCLLTRVCLSLDHISKMESSQKQKTKKLVCYLINVLDYTCSNRYLEISAFLFAFTNKNI